MAVSLARPFWRACLRKLDERSLFFWGGRHWCNEHGLEEGGFFLDHFPRNEHLEACTGVGTRGANGGILCFNQGEITSILEESHIAF